MNKRIFRTLLAATVAIIVFISGYLILTRSQSVQNKTSADIFENSAGGYSFKFPAEWKVSVNQYNENNSLFGPNASSSEGLGGVEVFNNEKSIDSFLGGVSAKYTNRANVVVDGINGLRENYEFYPISGEQVVLLKDGRIYNVYINSNNSDDLYRFDEIVSSFKFTNQ